jgi:exosortase
LTTHTANNAGAPLQRWGSARPATGLVALAASLLVAGSVALWAPTFWRLHAQVWQIDPYSQGPLAVAMAVLLFVVKVRQPRYQQARAAGSPQPLVSLAWLLPALALQVLGRSQGVLALEVLALPLWAIGITVGFWGAPAARVLWFCYAFLLFSVPLPPVLVDAVTQPMKIAVSWAAEAVLSAAGVMVAREGVILHVGWYRLLVADACAGLHSLFTLEAIGLLYLNLVRHPSPLRNLLMALFIVPVAFFANVLRVLVLVLATLVWGDAASGPMHDLSGLLLFALALGLIVLADGLARTAGMLWARRRRPERGRLDETPAEARP